MQLRMAMDKLKQALGTQITDDQLMALLRGDMETADPGGEAYGMQRSKPIFQDESEYLDIIDDIAETVADYDVQQRAAIIGDNFSPIQYL